MTLMKKLPLAPFRATCLSMRLLGLLLALVCAQPLYAQSAGPASLGNAKPASSESGLLSRLTQGQAQDSAAGGQALIQSVLGPIQTDEVEVSLVFSSRELVAGQTFEVGLRLRHAPLWHTYWVNPGDSGLPTEFELNLLDASGARLPLPLQPIQWPAPRRLPVGPLASYGFEGELLLARLAQLPQGLESIESGGAGFVPRALEVQANWLVCKDVCIPGDARFVIALRQASAQGIGSSATGNASAGTLQLEASESAVEPSGLKQARQSLPVLAPKSLGYAVSEDGAKLVVFGDDPAQAIEGGYLFLELEGLVQPASAQAVYQSSSQGFWLEIPLGGSSKRILQGLKAAPTPLYAVFRPQDPKAEPVRWSLRPTKQGAFEGFQEGPKVFSGPLPSRAALLDPGKTAEQAYQARKADSAPLAGSGLGLGLAFLLALVGGLLLNLMPCVFPVLGLKLLALSQHAQSQAHARRHAFIFTAGVLVSMLALASVLLGLRAAGEAIGWGFQLQNPWVVMGLALLFVAMALNFFGLYELGLGLARVGAQAEQNLKGSTDSGAFGSGVLAVIVASPCTAPFMGSALGFAVSAAHWSSGLLVFLGLGLGLALPFLVLAVVPGGTSLLPRPGPWMQTFRQFLGFPMLATAAWLVWVLIQQQGPDAGLGSLMALVLLAFALWLFGRLQTASFQSKAATGINRWLSPLSLVMSLIALIYLVALVGQGQPLVAKTDSAGRVNATLSQDNTTDSEAARADAGLPWRPGLAQELAAQGQVVFVDFTAAWCISCQANKARVLNRGEVAQRLGSKGYQLLTADWTRQDPVITAELTRHGRSGVPLYLVYGPALQEPLVLSEWLTEDQVVKAFQQAQAGR